MKLTDLENVRKLSTEYEAVEAALSNANSKSHSLTTYLEGRSCPVSIDVDPEVARSILMDRLKFLRDKIRLLGVEIE